MHVSNIEKSIVLGDKSAVAPADNAFAVGDVKHGGLRLRSKLQTHGLTSSASCAARATLDNADRLGS